MQILLRYAVDMSDSKPGSVTASDGKTVRRPGGRSAKVLSKVKTAVEQLMVECGTDAISLPMVAQRAGVQPSTLYRRWGDLNALMNELATYKLDPNRPIAATGDLIADLGAWAQGLVEHYRKPVNAAMLRAGAAAAGTAESDCLRNRRVEVARLLDAAPQTARISIDRIIDHIVAPIIYRTIYMPWTLDDRLVPGLVDELVNGDQATDD